MLRQMLTATALLAFCFVPATLAQDTTDYLGLPGPIRVGDTDYVLSWSSNPQPGYFKQEYLPAGAALDSYKSMVMVEFLVTDAPITEVVGAQTSMIEQRKSSDPIANFAVFENPDNGEHLLDFVLSAKDANGEFNLEWNGYRYAQSEFKGQRGFMLLAISERAYGDDASKAFLLNLREFKAQRLLELSQTELPELE